MARYMKRYQRQNSINEELECQGRGNKQTDNLVPQDSDGNSDTLSMKTNLSSRLCDDNQGSCAVYTSEKQTMHSSNKCVDLGDCGVRETLLDSSEPRKFREKTSRQKSMKDTCEMNSRTSSTDLEKDDKNSKGPFCLKLALPVLVAVVMVAGGGAIYLAVAPNNSAAEETVPNAMHVLGALSPHNGDEVFGRFTIDSDFLNEHKDLRFKPRGDIVNSGIRPSETDSCVVVDSEGMYKIESQMTYKFNANIPGPKAVHAIVLKVGFEEIQQIQVKRSVLVAKPYVETEGTILQASNINVLSYLKAHEKICVMVDPVDNIYNSVIDNMLDVERRFLIDTSFDNRVH